MKFLLRLFYFISFAALFLNVFGIHKNKTRIENIEQIGVNEQNTIQLNLTKTFSQIPTGFGNRNENVLNFTIVVPDSAEDINIESLGLKLYGKKNIAKLKIFKIKFSKAYDTSELVFETNKIEENLAFRKELNRGDNHFLICFDVNENAKEGDTIKIKINQATFNKKQYKCEYKNIENGSERLVLRVHKRLFKPGDFFSNYRVPSIISVGNMLFATIDGRPSWLSLPSPIDILLTRSLDNGKTWEPYTTIANFGNLQGQGASDATLIYHKPSKKIVCLFSSGNGLFLSTPQNKIRLNSYYSLDSGKSWMGQDITNQLYGDSCNNIETKNWFAVWAGGGTQAVLKNGRIIVAVGVREKIGPVIFNRSIFSDDGGLNWSVSKNNTSAPGNESHIVELENGKLLMSIRQSDGAHRMFATSTDNGLNWNQAQHNKKLKVVNANANIFRYSSISNGDKQNLILHSFCDTTIRAKLSVFSSTNEGETWNRNRIIYSQSSVIASITKLEDGSIGLLSEVEDGYGLYSIYFANFSLEWLMNKKSTTK